MSTSTSSTASLSDLLWLETSEKTEPNIFDRIPEEVLTGVFKWLNIKDLARCRVVCNRFRGNIDKSFAVFELDRSNAWLNMLNKR